jgi:hypothetical protein
MRVNLDDLNPPAWFDHPNSDDDARICLRVASASDLEKIQKKTIKKRVEYKRGQRFEVERVDEELQTALTWQWCIVDWEGLYDHNGDSIPCTDEHKVLLMLNAPQFSKWVIDCLDILNDDNVKREESAEKNFLNSQND